jgi:OFA family oxalate/formate antiporter-like MFS transporter
VICDKLTAAAEPAPKRRSVFNSRWTVAIAGTVMMMCLGTVYSWSLFARPLIAAFHWSSTTTMWAFSTAIFALGLGAVCGGRLQDRFGPRNVALAGVALWAMGNILAGLLTPRFGAAALYLSYGVMGGFGLGMGYVSPVAMVTKWFPDHRGFASGLVLTGFGLGAFFYNAIVPLFAPFALAAKDASIYLATGAPLSAADVQAIMTVFVCSGLAYLGIGGLCALLLRDPPADFGRRVSDPAKVEGRQYTPGEVLRTPQFYMLWLMLFFSVTAGILVISNAVPIFSDLTGASAAFAAPVVGLLAVFNGIGRVLWGDISDRIGRNTAFTLILGIQAVVFALMPMLHSTVLVGIAFGIVLLCNGGSFGTMPAFNADYFGTKYMGLNYGLIITAWGFAGVAGPLLAARVKDVTGSFGGTLVPLAIMLLLATIIPMVASKPGHTSRVVDLLRRRMARTAIAPEQEAA